MNSSFGSAPTIRDVAGRAGVSFQLAAAVLGGKKYARAAEVTRKKITDAARDLGYVPNVSARVLRGDPSRLLGVLIDSRAPESMFSVLAELEQAAAEKGYRILIAQAHDNTGMLIQTCRSLRQNGVDGVISFSHDYAQLGWQLASELKDDTGIVYVLNAPEGIGSSVDVDYSRGLKLAVNHLRKNGYRRTALILQGSRIENLPRSCARRLSGFQLACPEGEVILLKSPLNDLTALKKEFRSLVQKKLLPGPFDSAIVENDILAALLMKSLLARSIRIPRDFGLIGFDNLPIGECLPVNLSSLYYDKKALACTALDILLKKIDGNADPVRMLLPMKLISRESSGKRRYEV